MNTNTIGDAAGASAAKPLPYQLADQLLVARGTDPSAALRNALNDLISAADRLNSMNVDEGGDAPSFDATAVILRALLKGADDTDELGDLFLQMHAEVSAEWEAVVSAMDRSLVAQDQLND